MQRSLCSFQCSFWHSLEQYVEFLHLEHTIGGDVCQTLEQLVLQHDLAGGRGAVSGLAIYWQCGLCSFQ